MIRLLLLLLLLSPAISPARTLEPFAATYRLLLDGKLKGTTHFSLQTNEKGYSFESLTRPAPPPKRGHHEVLERSQGHFHGGHPQPDAYYYAVKTDRGTEMVEIFFDWKQKRMTLRSDRSQEQYRLETGTQDRLSYLLRAMALAAGHGNEATFPRISIEGAEHIVLRKKPKKHLTIPAGHFLVQELTIRSNNGQWPRKLWLAVREGYLPVALEHRTDQGLVRMELTRISSP
jgi:hypothetical protein